MWQKILLKNKKLNFFSENENVATIFLFFTFWRILGEKNH